MSSCALNILILSNKTPSRLSRISHRHASEGSRTDSLRLLRRDTVTTDTLRDGIVTKIQGGILGFLGRGFPQRWN